jgi:hypothetical protein
MLKLVSYCCLKRVNPQNRKGPRRDASLRLCKTDVVISFKKYQTAINLFDLAETERDLLVKRTQSGLMRVKADGGHFGGLHTSMVRPEGLVIVRLQRGEAAEALAREFGTCHQFIMRILKVNARNNVKIDTAN